MVCGSCSITTASVKSFVNVVYFPQNQCWVNHLQEDLKLKSTFSRRTKSKSLRWFSKSLKSQNPYLEVTGLLSWHKFHWQSVIIDIHFHNSVSRNWAPKIFCTEKCKHAPYWTKQSRQSPRSIRVIVAEFHTILSYHLTGLQLLQNVATDFSYRHDLLTTNDARHKDSLNRSF